MTGWIIFGSILLVLILILVQSVTVTGIYDQNPELRIKILCFTLVKVPPDPELQKKKAEKQAAKDAKKARKEAAKARKNKPAYNQALLSEAEGHEASGNSGDTSAAKNTPPAPEDEKSETAEDAKTAKKEKKAKAPKKGGGIDFDMIMDYVRSASPPVKRLFKKIRIRDVYIDWVAGSDDAAKTALKYGGICAAVYSAAEFIKSFFRTTIKEINIEADFSAEKDDIFAYAVLKLRISTALGCVIWLAFRMLRTFLKYNGNTKTKAKAKPRPVRAK